MKIRDVLREKNPISFEIFPPKGELSMESFRETLSALSALSPDFISVTCSAGGSGNHDRTAELAGIIQKEYGIVSCAHLTCVNSDSVQLAADVERLQANGIENVLALRGDIIPGVSTRVFAHAVELMEYLHGKGFCIGGACYPEGHIECSDPAEDLQYLYLKQQAGAEFFVSQLFFDNDCFYRFLDKAGKIGITIPILPGVMPILSKAQIERMIFTCGASLPSAIIRILTRYEKDPESLRKAGIDYAVSQICELRENGADGIHIYTMNRPQIATQLLDGMR